MCVKAVDERCHVGVQDYITLAEATLGDSVLGLNLI